MATENTYPETNSHSEIIVVPEQNDAGAENKQAAAHMLYRSPTDKRLSGVCGGIGDYFNIDPVLIRLGWIFAAIATGGVALLVYGLMWLLLPVGTQDAGEQESAVINLGDNNMKTVAWVLIGLGVLWLLANTGILAPVLSGFWSVMGVLFWPALLIVAGYLLLRKNGDGDALSRNVKERIPDTDSVKQSVESARERFPLKRSSDDRVLLGVCGGIAERLNIDPIIVRVLWALFSIGSMGTGVILYIVMAVIMPEDQSTSIEAVEGEVLDPIQQ